MVSVYRRTRLPKVADDGWLDDLQRGASIVDSFVDAAVTRALDNVAGIVDASWDAFGASLHGRGLIGTDIFADEYRDTVHRAESAWQGAVATVEFGWDALGAAGYGLTGWAGFEDEAQRTRTAIDGVVDWAEAGWSEIETAWHEGRYEDLATLAGHLAADQVMGGAIARGVGQLGDLVTAGRIPDPPSSPPASTRRLTDSLSTTAIGQIGTDIMIDRLRRAGHTEEFECTNACGHGVDLFTRDSGCPRYQDDDRQPGAVAFICPASASAIRRKSAPKRNRS